MRRLATLLALLALLVPATAEAHHRPWHKKPKPSPTVPTSPPAAPSAPGGFTASVGAASVLLEWTSVDSRATTLVLKRNGVRIAELRPSSRSFADRNVQTATTYSYEIVAGIAWRSGVVYSRSAFARVTLPSYKVGAAAFDISPDLVGLRDVHQGGNGIGDGAHTLSELAGPGNVNRTTVERIKARAVVFDDGKKAIALATIETQGYFAAYRDGLKGLADMAAAAAQPNMPATSILIAADHTHSGPDTIGAWGGMPKSYFDLVYKQTVAAIRTAYAHRQFANVVAGHSSAYDLIYNQSCAEALYQDGDLLVSGGDDLPCPTGSAQGAKGTDGKDGLFRVVQARAPGGEVIVTYAAYAAHATAGGGDGVHGDWPQFLGDAMAARYGGVGMAMQGAVGKTQPCRPHCAFTSSSNPSVRMVATRKDQIVANYLAHVSRALSTAGRVSGPVNAAQARIREVVTSPAVLGLFTAGGTAFGARLLRSMDPPWQNANTISTVVAALRVGDVLFAGAPGEAYPEIAFGIRDGITGAREVITLSLANDQVGYLIAPAGDYPVITAQVAVNDNTIFNVSPTIGDHVMCADIRLAKAIGFGAREGSFGAYCAPYDAMDASGDPIGKLPVGGVSVDEL